MDIFQQLLLTALFLLFSIQAYRYWTPQRIERFADQNGQWLVVEAIFGGNHSRISRLIRFFNALGGVYLVCIVWLDYVTLSRDEAIGAAIILGCLAIIEIVYHLRRRHRRAQAADNA